MTVTKQFRTIEIRDVTARLCTSISTVQGSRLQTSPQADIHFLKLKVAGPIAVDRSHLCGGNHSPFFEAVHESLDQIWAIPQLDHVQSSNAFNISVRRDRSFVAKLFGSSLERPSH